MCTHTHVSPQVGACLQGLLAVEPTGTGAGRYLPLLPWSVGDKTSPELRGAGNRPHPDGRGSKGALGKTGEHL